MNTQAKAEPFILATPEKTKMLQYLESLHFLSAPTRYPITHGEATGKTQDKPVCEPVLIMHPEKKQSFYLISPITLFSIGIFVNILIQIYINFFKFII